MAEQKMCRSCNGSGRIPLPAPLPHNRPCWRCDSKGVVAIVAKSLLAFTLLCGQAFAAPPLARIGSTIEEDAIIEPGDPLEFTADSLAENDKCKWRVRPANTLTGKPTHKVSADKRTLTIFSRVGRYDIRLTVWNAEDSVEAEQIITVGKPTIIVGPPPLTPQKPIDPIIPDPIDPLPESLGLSKIITDSVRLNVPVAERAFAAKLADNYRVGATNIANGTWPVATAIKSQFDVNTATPGYKDIVWRQVFRDISTRLAAARNAGQFTTQKQYVTAFAEIALGFAEAAK